MGEGDGVDEPSYEEYEWSKDQLQFVVRAQPRSWNIQLPLQGAPEHFYVAGTISVTPGGKYRVDERPNQEFNTFEDCLEYFMGVKYAESQATQTPQEGGE